MTGGAGFIGSTYVRLFAGEHDIAVLDKLTYAGRRENLPEGVELVVGGIEDREPPGRPHAEAERGEPVALRAHP